MNPIRPLFGLHEGPRRFPFPMQRPLFPGGPGEWRPPFGMRGPLGPNFQCGPFDPCAMDMRWRGPPEFFRGPQDFPVRFPQPLFQSFENNRGGPTPSLGPKGKLGAQKNNPGNSAKTGVAKPSLKQNAKPQAGGPPKGSTQNANKVGPNKNTVPPNKAPEPGKKASELPNKFPGPSKKVAEPAATTSGTPNGLSAPLKKNPDTSKKFDVVVRNNESDNKDEPPNKKQRTIESRAKYCTLCEVRYTESTTEHRQSREHKTNKALLNPVCAECKLSFDSATSYYVHCNIVHKKAATLTVDFNESSSHSNDNSDDEYVSDMDSTIDPLFFLDQSDNEKLAVSGNDVDCDNGLTSEDSSGDEKKCKPVVEKKSKLHKPSKSLKSEPPSVSPKKGESDSKQIKNLPEFVVPACYCNLCCVFFHDDENVIKLHCQSRKHLESST